jgi:hypothetical protein
MLVMGTYRCNDRVGLPMPHSAPQPIPRGRENLVRCWDESTDSHDIDLQRSYQKPSPSLQSRAPTSKTPGAAGGSANCSKLFRYV